MWVHAIEVGDMEFEGFWWVVGANGGKPMFADVAAGRCGVLDTARELTGSGADKESSLEDI